MRWLTVDGISRLVMAPEDDGKGGGAEKTQAEKDMDVLREENTKLANKNRELLTEAGNIKDKLKLWDGLDPTAIRTMMNQFSEDEDLKLIAEGKHEEVIKKRTERVSAEHKTQMTEKETEIVSLRTERDSYRNQVSELLVDGTAVAEFAKAGGVDTAIDDIKLRAKTVFKVEKGEAIARDAAGEIITGKNGPLTISEWVESLREKAPHFFPASTGSNAGGNGGQTKLTGLDGQIEAARKAGDVTLLRELQAKKRSGK